MPRRETSRLSRSTGLRSALAALCAVVLSYGPGLRWAGAAPGARAEERQPVREAEDAESLRRADAAFAAGDYGEAIRQFEKARGRTGDARLDYNLGLCHLRRFEKQRRNEDLHAAQRLFRAFLENLRPERYPREEQRRQLLAVQGLARRHLVEVERLLGRAPQRLAEPAASRPVRRLVVPPSEATPPRPPALRVAPQPPRRRRHEYLVLYGLAGACGLAAVITGSLALGAQAEARELATTGRVDETNARADRADRLALGTDLLLGLAVASAAVGLVLHVLEHRARRRALEWEVSGNRLALRLMF